MSEAKYEVFISSTRKDLVKIRDCIINATLENGHLPCAMEHFAGAGYQSTNTLDLTRVYIRRSDIFVHIVGAHYGTELNLGHLEEEHAQYPDGTLDTDQIKPLSSDMAIQPQTRQKGDFLSGIEHVPGKSFTSQERVYADELGKPIILLLLEKEKAKEARNRVEDAEKEKENDYWSSREQLDNPLVIKCPFDSLTDESKINDLGKKYVIALNRVTKRLELDGKGGWNRANSDLMADIITKLNSNTKLGDRAEKNSDLKIGIARFFIKTFLPTLISGNYRKFFFESGSSTAFVAKEFVDLFRVDPTIPWALTSKNVQIKTNNVIAHIYVLLNLRVKKLDFYPQGIPKDEYGATYGQLEEFIGHRCACNLKKNPENFSRYIGKHEKVKKVLTEITNNFDNYSISSTKKEARGMIFMAASGIGISPGFEGPHVGSFINMLFKKSILASKCPTVMFLDQTKLPKESMDRYPVCDDKLTWSDICNGSISSPFQDGEDLPKKEKPFAIAIGRWADEDDKISKEIEKHLEKFSLHYVVERKIRIDNKDVIGLVAANENFRKIICPP